MTRSNQSAKTNDPRRRADLATIHMAGKAQFGDVSRDGLGRDDYEDWLAQIHDAQRCKQGDPWA